MNLSNSGTFSLAAGVSQTISSLDNSDGTATVNLNTGTLRVGSTDNLSSTYAGSFTSSSGGTLIQAGTGTLTLTGNSTSGIQSGNASASQRRRIVSRPRRRPRHARPSRGEPRLGANLGASTRALALERRLQRPRHGRSERQCRLPSATTPTTSARRFPASSRMALPPAAAWPKAAPAPSRSPEQIPTPAERPSVPERSRSGRFSQAAPPRRSTLGWSR